jgi:hypothetical protein
MLAQEPTPEGIAKLKQHIAEHVPQVRKEDTRVI